MVRILPLPLHPFSLSSPSGTRPRVGLRGGTGMWRRTVRRRLAYFVRNSSQAPVQARGALFKSPLRAARWVRVPVTARTFGGRERQPALPQVSCSLLLERERGKKKKVYGHSCHLFQGDREIVDFCLLLYLLWALSLLFLLSFLSGFLSRFHNSLQKWASELTRVPPLYRRGNEAARSDASCSRSHI